MFIEETSAYGQDATANYPDPDLVGGTLYIRLSNCVSLYIMRRHSPSPRPFCPEWASVPSRC
jgi:hypothetical protein